MSFKQFLQEQTLKDDQVLKKVFPREKLISEDGTVSVLLKEKPANVYADLTRHGWVPLPKVATDGYYIGKHKDYPDINLKIGFFREGSFNTKISVLK